MISPLQPLELEDLTHILTDPKNSLVKQYKKFFEMESAELEFTPESLIEIARIAKTKNTVRAACGAWSTTSCSR